MRTILLFTILTVINEHATRELKLRDVLVPYTCKWKTNLNFFHIGIAVLMQDRPFTYLSIYRTDQMQGITHAHFNCVRLQH